MPLVADYALPRLRESIRIHLTAEIAKEAQSTQKVDFAAFSSPVALRSPRSISFVSLRLSLQPKMIRPALSHRFSQLAQPQTRRGALNENVRQSKSERTNG